MITYKLKTNGFESGKVKLSKRVNFKMKNH